MILTESSDSTDYIMGAQTGLFDCLKDGEVGGLLKSLIVSRTERLRLWRAANRVKREGNRTADGNRGLSLFAVCRLPTNLLPDPLPDLSPIPSALDT